MQLRNRKQITVPSLRKPERKFKIEKSKPKSIFSRTEKVQSQSTKLSNPILPSKPNCILVSAGRRQNPAGIFFETRIINLKISLKF